MNVFEDEIKDIFFQDGSDEIYVTEIKVAK